WMPEKTRIWVTSRGSWSRWVVSADEAAVSAGLRLARGATTKRCGRRSPLRLRIEENPGHYTDCSGNRLLNLVAVLLARAPGAAAAGMARRGRGGRGARPPEGEPAA